jgi:streptogramin lyase
VTDHRYLTRLAALAAALSLAACGGGGSHILPTATTPNQPAGAVPTGAPGTPSSAQQATAKFTIAVPSASTTASSSTRKLDYVSPKTGSASIAVLSVGGTPIANDTVVTKIAYGAPGCSTNTAQPLSCTVAIGAPVGETAFRMSLFASSDGSGTALATSTFSATIAANTNNVVPVTLGGVVDHVGITPAHIPFASDGAIHTQLLSVVAYDAAGETIVGPGNFASPVTLSVKGGTDPNGALMITQPTITSPGQPVEVKYDGSKVLSDGQIQAAVSVGDAQPTTTVQADVVPLNYAPNKAAVYITGAPEQIAVSEAGFTGQFTLSISDPTVASATISATSGGTATITVTPPPGGSYDGQTSLTLSDQTTTATIPLVVTYPQLTNTVNLLASAHPNGMAMARKWINSPVAPDEAYYFSDGTAKEFSEVEPGAGLFKQYTSPLEAQAITVGTDGALWLGFGDYSGANLCTYNFSTNTPTCYPTTANIIIENLTTGADGTIWFTQRNPAAIVAFNPTTHAFTPYTTGLGTTARPYGITLGSDGNIWFTDQNFQQPAIGKLTVSSGAISEYSAGLNPNGTQSNPWMITAGPDGNLWFTDQNFQDMAIGRVSVANGQITEYSTGLQRNPYLQGITAGPDGNVWFGDQGVELLVGAINPSTGAIQEYSLSNPAIVYNLLPIDGGLAYTDPFGRVGYTGGVYGLITLPTNTSQITGVRRKP